MTGRLEGRRALVTGGTRGIGAAISLALAAEGATVVVHARGDASSRAFADEHGLHLVTADFTRLDEVAPMGDAAVELLGGLDILVNNAGMEVLSTVGHLDAAEVTRQLAVDLEAPILLTNRLVPALKRGNSPSIINVSSIHGTVPSWANSVYGSAKAGLELFTHTLAVELGPHGVRANVLAPGAIETEMNRDVLDTIGRELFAEWIPLGHVGQVSDVAGPVVFLASDEAKYITGATLTVDGGYSHHVVRYRMPGVDGPNPMEES